MIDTHTPAHRNDRQGFTLVELLVAVAIFIALLAILIPSMGRAIFAGQKVVCASNYHQIGIGMVNYAGDWMSRFPRHDFDDKVGGRQSWDVNNNFLPAVFKYVNWNLFYKCPIAYPGKEPYSERIKRPLLTLDDVYADRNNPATNYPQWTDSWWVPRYAPKFPGKFGGPQWVVDHPRHERYVTDIGHYNVSRIPIMSNFMARPNGTTALNEYGNIAVTGNHHREHIYGDRLDSNTLLYGDLHVDFHDFAEIELICSKGYANWF